MLDQTLHHLFPKTSVSKYLLFIQIGAKILELKCSSNKNFSVKVPDPDSCLELISPGFFVKDKLADLFLNRLRAIMANFG